MIFDTHVHYDDDAFDEDRQELVSSLPGAGIGRAVDVASTLDSLERVRKITEDYPFIFGAFGIHPDDAPKMNEDRMQELCTYCRLEKTAAVGEIGLDYHWGKETREVQMEWFERQLLMADDEGLPVIIHSRDAAADTLDILKQNGFPKAGGVMHCFSYSQEMAREYLNRGFFLGIGGVVTFKNAKRLKDIVRYAPLENLVLETDCPYLTPEPFRGRRNSSLNLVYVKKAIAEIKAITPEEVEKTTWENACRLFGMSR